MKRGRWRDIGVFSPVSVMLLTLLFIILTQWAAIYLLLHQPWTGLKIEPDPASGFVRVISVDQGSPAEGKIEPETILTQIQFAGDVVPLTDKHFLFTFMHKDRAELQVYLQQQAKIHAFLSMNKPVEFMDAGSKKHVLLPQPTTPIRTIPVYFWVFLLVFSVVPLMGAFVSTYKPSLAVSKLFFIASIACYGLNFIGVLNLAKEFFFSFKVAEWLFILELILPNIYMPCNFNIISSFPSKIASTPIQISFFFIFSFYSLNFYFSWFVDSVNWILIQSILPFLLTLLASHIQLLKNRHNPFDRTATRVMQLSMLAPFVPFILLYIIPIALDNDPIISKNFAQLFVIISFIGLAIGILRFRLFEVEYWWFKSWLWLLGGCVVVLVDILLIGWLNTPQVYALGLSVMLTGFLYFPLRQWVLAKFTPLENQSLQEFLPRFSASLAQADSPQAFEHSWQAVLQARFMPQHLAVHADSLTEPTLTDNGLSLSVPTLSAGMVYQLSGKQMAARLFSKTDQMTASTLLDIVRMARNVSDARAQAVLEERERLLQDLKATVGAKLQALAADLAEPVHRQATEEALQTLDSTVTLSLQVDPFSLLGHLQAWQTEIIRRTAVAGVRLDWQVGAGLEQAELSSKQALELTQFLREAVSNALKHAHPSCLAIHFWLEAGRLQVNIDNDGDIQPPDSWNAGTGLNGMKERIRALHGDLSIQYLAQQGHVRLGAVIPL